MRLAFAPYLLKFKQPAGTSRGVLLEKPTYFIKVWQEDAPEIFGIGEAAVFPGLSPEADATYEYKLAELLANVALGRSTDLSRHSSICFGFEQALLDFASGGKGLYFPSGFTQGEKEICINGLIWMGSREEMTQRVAEKIEQGFRCIKIKVGAIDWKSEIGIIEEIRKHFSSEILTIRVDANGGFSMQNALPRMKHLHDLDVESIEQPIPKGNRELMAFLCDVSPLPIALDEELIGISDTDNKKRLLDEIKPAFIVLKPALCGGFSGAAEWIDLAAERGIGWWITSALESNLGLNALAQWTATLATTRPQGLGTGALFTNNLPSPLRLQGEMLRYSPDASIDRAFYNSLSWRE